MDTNQPSVICDFSKHFPISHPMHHPPRPFLNPKYDADKGGEFCVVWVKTRKESLFCKADALAKLEIFC